VGERKIASKIAEKESAKISERRRENARQYETWLTHMRHDSSNVEFLKSWRMECMNCHEETVTRHRFSKIWTVCVSTPHNAYIIYIPHTGIIYITHTSLHNTYIKFHITHTSSQVHHLHDHACKLCDWLGLRRHMNRSICFYTHQVLCVCLHSHVFFACIRMSQCTYVCMYVIMSFIHAYLCSYGCMGGLFECMYACMPSLYVCMYSNK